MKQLLIRKMKEYIGAPSNLRLEHCIKNSIKRFVASRRSDKEDYFGYKKGMKIIIMLVAILNL